MRYLTLSLAIIALSITAIATAAEDSLSDTAPALAQKLPHEMPIWDPEHDSYKDPKALVPGAASTEPTALSQSQSSITVTAVVLPVRIVQMTPDGGLQISANTTEPSWWVFQDPKGNKIKITEKLWQKTGECLAKATKETGIICKL